MALSGPIVALPETLMAPTVALPETLMAPTGPKMALPGPNPAPLGPGLIRANLAIPNSEVRRRDTHARARHLHPPDQLDPNPGAAQLDRAPLRA